MLVQADEIARIHMRNEIYGLGMAEVAASRTRVEANGSQYSISSDVESRGVARLFLNLTTHSEVRGRLMRDQPQPESYRGEVHRNGTDSYNRVDYGSDGSAIGAAS